MPRLRAACATTSGASATATRATIPLPTTGHDDGSGPGGGGRSGTHGISVPVDLVGSGRGPSSLSRSDLGGGGGRDALRRPVSVPRSTHRRGRRTRSGSAQGGFRCAGDRSRVRPGRFGAAQVVDRLLPRGVRHQPFRRDQASLGGLSVRALLRVPLRIEDQACRFSWPSVRARACAPMAWTCPLRAPWTNQSDASGAVAAIVSSMLIMGVSPTPPLTRTTGASVPRSRKKSPAGGAALTDVPGPAWSCSQFETMPAGTSGEASRFTVMR